MVATLMARQGDSQLALSTPALLTDHYVSQRGLQHGLSMSAARNVLSLPDHATDFGIRGIFPVTDLLTVGFCSTGLFSRDISNFGHVPRRIPEENLHGHCESRTVLRAGCPSCCTVKVNSVRPVMCIANS